MVGGASPARHRGRRLHARRRSAGRDRADRHLRARFRLRLGQPVLRAGGRGGDPLRRAAARSGAGERALHPDGHGLATGRVRDARAGARRRPRPQPALSLRRAPFPLLRHADLDAPLDDRRAARAGGRARPDGGALGRCPRGVGLHLSGPAAPQGDGLPHLRLRRLPRRGHARAEVRHDGAATLAERSRLHPRARRDRHGRSAS